MDRNDKNKIIEYIDSTTNYDRNTIKFNYDGEVTAKLDPNKDPGCHNIRLNVGYAPYLLEDAQEYLKNS